MQKMKLPKGVAILDGRIIHKRIITETELLTVETARARVAAMKAELEAHKAAVAQLERDIIDRIEVGCRIVGNLTALVIEDKGKRTPKWKELYLDHLHTQHGVDMKAEEARVLETTAPSMRETLIIGVRPGKSQ